MWALLRLGFRLRSNAERLALKHLPNLYRIAFFLTGSKIGAEETVEAAYRKVWREHIRGSPIGNWEVALLVELMEAIPVSPFRRAVAGPDAPPLWETLASIDPGKRAILLLGILDVPLKNIAVVARISEPVAAQRLIEAREELRLYLGGNSPEGHDALG